jgi:hypothetical protein
VKTAILPIVGITRQATLHPLKANRQESNEAIVTTMLEEINNSGYFSSIHSTKSTEDEGRWLLIVADKDKSKEATKYINQLTKSIYTAAKSQIPIDARILVYPIPEIEKKSQTMARATKLNSGQQASAWGQQYLRANKLPN